MAFLWLLPCFALIWAAFGDGAPASQPELSIMPRIINGKDAHPGSWPWHVAIQSQYGVIFCGGTLIDRFWVMTAAHCNISLSEWVIIGLYDRNLPLETHQVLRIDKIFMYPYYNSSTFFGDITLLRLTSPAPINDTVYPAVLPRFAEELSTWTRCIIMGWGYTHPESTMVPLKLQQATVNVISNTECKKHWSHTHSVTMVCAWAKDISNFKGDSGSPLLCPKKGIWKVMGIASHINITHPTSKPVVFMRVSPFIPWIQKVMAHN